MRLFITGLALIFIALKLTGDIIWPWWLVLSPLWAPAALVGAICSMLAIFSKRFRQGFKESFRKYEAQRKARKTLETFMNRKDDDFEA
jgi:hypothetical protein